MGENNYYFICHGFNIISKERPAIFLIKNIQAVLQKKNNNNNNNINNVRKYNNIWHVVNIVFKEDNTILLCKNIQDGMGRRFTI